MTDACRRIYEDPEMDPSHLDTCEECRRAFAAMESEPIVAPIEVRELETGDLPLAPWEGASHKPWGLLLAGMLILAIGAMLLYWIAGTSPVTSFVDAIGNAVVPRVDPLKVASSLSKLVWTAPSSFRWFLGIGFIAVNVIFIAMLRRSPKGFDATPR